MSKGFLLIATAEEYKDEAIRTAWKINSEMDVGVTLITDVETESDVFDDIIYVEDSLRHWGDKVKYIDMTPYDRTIFVDNDIHMIEGISEVFEILDCFDIAIKQDENHTFRGSYDKMEEYPVKDVPSSFPEYNTGLIAFKDNDRVDNLFTKWQKIYDKYDEEFDAQRDQPSFRKAIYQSKCRIATLPTEYNCRFREAGYLHSNVKILHGRHPSVEAVEHKLNKSDENRVFAETKTGLKVVKKEEKNPVLQILEREGYMGTLMIFLNKLNKDGIKSTFSSASTMLKN